jgi:aminopeptidase N
MPRLAALSMLVHMPQTQREAAKALDKFLKEWNKDLLLMNKWFSIQATGTPFTHPKSIDCRLLAWLASRAQLPALACARAWGIQRRSWIARCLP